MGLIQENINFALPKRFSNSKIMHIKLLILDFDGTIADTSAGIVSTMTKTFQKVGLPVPGEMEIRRTIGLPLAKSIAMLGGIEGKELDEAVTAYREIFEEVGVPATTLFPYVAETLEEIHKRGIVCTIATSRGHASVGSLCRKMGIDGYISLYVAEDDVVRKKPEPEAVELTLRTTGIDKANAAIVGDTTFDIEMGKAAGCHTIGACYGNHTRQMLETAGADWVVDNFGELLKMV